MLQRVKDNDMTRWLHSGLGINELGRNCAILRTRQQYRPGAPGPQEEDAARWCLPRAEGKASLRKTL